MSTYIGGLSGPKKFTHICIYIYIYTYICMERHNFRYHECISVCIYITHLQCHSELPAAISPTPSVFLFPPWRLNIAKSRPDARRGRTQESDAPCGRFPRLHRHCARTGRHDIPTHPASAVRRDTRRTASASVTRHR